MILTEEEVSHLLQIVRLSKHQTFDEIKKEFCKQFKLDMCSRVVLVLNGVLESKFLRGSFVANEVQECAGVTEVMICFYLLFIISESSNDSCNPTKGILYECLDRVDKPIREYDEKKSKESNDDRKAMRTEAEWCADEEYRNRMCMKYFIFQLLMGNKDTMEQCKPFDLYYTTELATIRSFFDSIEIEKLKVALASLKEERDYTIPGMLGTGKTPLLENPDEVYDETTAKRRENIDKECIAASASRFEPILCRPEPPLLPMQPNELIFLHSDGIFSDILADISPMSQHIFEPRHIVMTTKWNDHIVNNHLYDLTRDLKCSLSYIGVTPEKFAEITEKDSGLAEKLLPSVLAEPSSDLYLQALLETETVCVHQVELVARTARDKKLPKSFLLKYTNRLIQLLMKTKLEKSSDASKIRLAAIFILSLLKDKTMVIEKPDQLPEIKSFCSEHSQVKECSDLYAYLQKLTFDRVVDEYDDAIMH